MNIFVFSAHSLWTVHYATELELIEGHLNNGDNVFHMTCFGELRACDMNLTHEFQTCFHCADQTTCGRQLLTKKTISLPIVKLSKSRIREIGDYVGQLKYTTVAELQELNYKNFDLGYAVAATLISLKRDSQPKVLDLRDQIDSLLRSSIEVYETTKEYIDEHKPDRVYAFNGRFAQMKAVLRACQVANVECLIHERGADQMKYELWKNTTPHDIKYMVNKINEHWDNADPVLRETLGSSFYEERIKGVDQGWLSFTKDQLAILPADWNPAKRNIVIFNSSEDEFSSIGPEWYNPLYKDQITGIKELAEDLKSEENTMIYLRVHPNLKGVDDYATRAIQQLNYSNLVVIPADSTISSYELLVNASVAISFGSTMGIEAVYWGIPSISLGMSFYYDLNTTHNPKSHQELLELLKGKPSIFGKEQALKFGYFYKTFGLAYKNYKPDTLFTGLFKEVDFRSQSVYPRKKYLKLFRIPLMPKPLYIFESLFQKNKWKLPLRR